MPVILHRLPFEIIELVSSSLSTHDLLEAIRVSKSWHSLFYTFLYRHISIQTHERLYRILSAFKSDLLLPAGHLVRSLDLKNMQLSPKELLCITEVFPEIDRLDIDWSIWGSLPDDDNTHYDSNAPISFIHPTQGLSPTMHHLFNHYGSKNLRHLSLDTLNYESTDIWSILALCPHLKTLHLLNLNYEHIITLGYIETIHRLCPHLVLLEIKCTRADPSPALLPEFSESEGPIRLRSTLLTNFSLSSKSGAGKWPLWLPYFAVKYPYLEHVSFKHCGLGKDGDGGYNKLPERAYAMFIHSCRQLKSIRWNKITIHHEQQEALFHNKLCNSSNSSNSSSSSSGPVFKNLKRIDGYENFNIPGSLVHSPIIQPGSILSELLTSLTIGRPPVNSSTSQIIQAVGQCKNLIDLKIQECYVNPELAYDMEEILMHCKKLRSLYIKDTHLKTTTSAAAVAVAAGGGGGGGGSIQIASQHPLKKLILKRSSFTQDVFGCISGYCPDLNHLELLGCFQTDRRDQVMIELPRQRLKTLKVQGLRTRNYYTGCRIRFFSVKTEDRNDWYYMSRYDINYHPVGKKRAFQKYRNMEFARCLDTLDDRDVQELKSLVTTKNLKAWDINAVKNNLLHPYTCHLDQACWDPENIYYSGLVKVVCYFDLIHL
ncbi:hypothetical protein BD770DRAFT_391513 [Pilaira anomala]|nr:hypothetical protein BD770DRAFT_391513 [Pilaira anomala]